MKHISLYLALALAVVVGIVGYGFGLSQTPQYKQFMLDKSSMGLGQADALLDKRYLENMIVHHQTALDLATQVSTLTNRPEIKNLSQEIINTEPGLIAELYDFRRDWYQDESSVDSASSINLGEYDDNLDLRFLNALIFHHQDGIAMTQEVRMKSVNSQTLNNADSVENFLRKTLPVLEQMRADWYQVK